MYVESRGICPSVAGFSHSACPPGPSMLVHVAEGVAHGSHLSWTFRSLPRRVLAVVNNAAADMGVHVGPDFTFVFFWWGRGDKYL